MSNGTPAAGETLCESRPARNTSWPRLGCGFPRQSGSAGCNLDLDASPPYLRVRQAIVKGIVGAPESRHGARTIPLTDDLGRRLPRGAAVGYGAREPGLPQRPRAAAATRQSEKNRVLAQAAARAGASGIGLHTLRHTCASLLIERGASPLRLQRWMGHHAAAYTLDTHRHLIDDELGDALDLDSLTIAKPSKD